jgi:hypothetical protein
MRALSFTIGSAKRRFDSPNELNNPGRGRLKPSGSGGSIFPGETWTREIAWRAGLRCLTGDHPAHGPHQLLSLFVGIGRAAVPADQAVTDVAVQQPEADLVERCPRGVDLGHDIDAVAVFLDHLGDAPDLTLDPGQTIQQLLLRRRVSACLGCHGCLLLP